MSNTEVFFGNSILLQSNLEVRGRAFDKNLDSELRYPDGLGYVILSWITDQISIEDFLVESSINAWP